MAKKRQTTKRHSLRRGKKHALSANVVSTRIVFLTLFRKAKHLFIYSIVTCLLILFCWGIFYSARKLVMEGDRFQLEAIQISPLPTKNSFFTYQNLPEITGINISDSIFAHNLSAIEKRLEAYPELERATLTREFPGTIKIQLEERTPVAKVSYKGLAYLVDSSGFCFNTNLSNPRFVQNLPTIQVLHKHDLPFDLETKIIQGVGLQRALELTKVWNEHILFGEQLLNVKVKDLHSLTAQTSSGTTLTFGYYEHERQIQDFNSIQNHANEERVYIKTANLLPFENIPVVFDDSAAPKKKELQAPAPKKKPEVNSDLMKILNQG